eukprot:1160600-Pelagomonas_calceolata.AAC.1
MEPCVVAHMDPPYAVRNDFCPQVTACVHKLPVRLYEGPEQQASTDHTSCSICKSTYGCLCVQGGPCNALSDCIRRGVRCLVKSLYRRQCRQQCWGLRMVNWRMCSIRFCSVSVPEAPHRTLCTQQKRSLRVEELNAHGEGPPIFS